MDYQIVLSPEFSINPDAFLSAWNDDVDCRDIALAERVDQPQRVSLSIRAPS